MTESFLERTTTAPVRRRLFLGTLLAITALTSLIVLLMPYGSRQTTLPITVGDVAGQDVLAPRALSFTSDVLTAQRQEDAVEIGRASCRERVC